MTTIATPSTLAKVLAAVQPFDTILLRGGNYPGGYTVKTAGVVLEPYEQEPAIFTGITDPASKAAWITVAASAKGCVIRDLTFDRPGDIAKLAAASWHDFGIAIEAPDVRVENCRLRGMCKGIQVRGKTSTGVTLRDNHIGPTIQSNIVVATSYGVIRGLLIIGNDLEGSYIEDGIQFMQDYDAAKPAADVSNLGTVIYQNRFSGHGENGIDLKGAGLVVIDGNTFDHIAGSNNGPLNGWNHNGGPVIFRGKGTASGHAIIRNNRVTQSGGGMLVLPNWYVYHNELTVNNWTPDGSAYAGMGIGPRQDGPTAVIVNNWVVGHKGGNVTIPASAIVRNNPPTMGPGVALTTTAGEGHGDVLTVADARYFTDWLGRNEPPPEIIYVGTQRAQVFFVDYDRNELRLDRAVKWADGDPVYWMTSAPTVGMASAYVEPAPVEPPIVVEPPVITEPPAPVEPPAPTIETVRLFLDLPVSPGLAAELRNAVASGAVRVTWG